MAALMSIILQHRPGWGFSVGFHSRGFHAVVSSPECQQVGKAGRLFSGRAATPSKALLEAFTASGPPPKGTEFPFMAVALALALTPAAGQARENATHAVRQEAA